MIICFGFPTFCEVKYDFFARKTINNRFEQQCARECSQNYDSPMTRVTKFKVAPNIADPISIEDSVSSRKRSQLVPFVHLEFKLQDLKLCGGISEYFLENRFWVTLFAFFGIKLNLGRGISFKLIFTLQCKRRNFRFELWLNSY